MVKAWALLTKFSQSVLMAPSATALVEERAASSTTRSVTMDRDAASSAGVGSLTAPGLPRTATNTTGSEFIMQGIAGQATDHTSGDQELPATNNEDFLIVLVDPPTTKCFISVKRNHNKNVLDNWKINIF